MCIDDKKTYNYLYLLNKYEKICSDICINWNYKKYIIEETLCVNSCFGQYKYEYDDICYKECPSGFECELAYTDETENYYYDDVVIFPKDSEKKSSSGKIIGIIAGAVVIIAVIVTIIIIKIKKLCCFKSVEVVFIHNNTETKIDINPEDTVNNSFIKYMGTNRLNKEQVFVFEGKYLATEENKKTKIKQYMNESVDGNILKIKVMDAKDCLKIKFSDKLNMKKLLMI